MACFVLARGAETAEDLEGQEARLEYEALRSAHLCFAELLVCVWSRVRGEEEFKRKVKELEVKSAAYQTALVNWIGPTAMMHYAHVPTHFAEQQDWLSQFLLNLIDGSGGVGEAQNNVLKQCKKNHTSNRKAPCAQKRALGVTGKHAHVEQRIDAKRQCLQYQSVKVICRGQDSVAADALARGNKSVLDLVHVTPEAVKVEKRSAHWKVNGRKTASMVTAVRASTASAARIECGRGAGGAGEGVPWKVRGGGQGVDGGVGKKTKEAYLKLTVPVLKSLLKGQKKKQGGNKLALVLRLMEGGDGE